MALFLRHHTGLLIPVPNPANGSSCVEEEAPRAVGDPRLFRPVASSAGPVTRPPCNQDTFSLSFGNFDEFKSFITEDLRSGTFGGDEAVDLIALCGASQDSTAGAIRLGAGISYNYHSSSPDQAAGSERTGVSKAVAGGSDGTEWQGSPIGLVRELTSDITFGDFVQVTEYSTSRSSVDGLAARSLLTTAQASHASHGTTFGSLSSPSGSYSSTAAQTLKSAVGTQEAQDGRPEEVLANGGANPAVASGSSSSSPSATGTGVGGFEGATADCTDAVGIRITPATAGPAAVNNPSGLPAARALFEEHSGLRPTNRIAGEGSDVTTGSGAGSGSARELATVPPHRLPVQVQLCLRFAYGPTAPAGLIAREAPPPYWPMDKVLAMSKAQYAEWVSDVERAWYAKVRGMPQWTRKLSSAKSYAATDGEAAAGGGDGTPPSSRLDSGSLGSGSGGVARMSVRPFGSSNNNSAGSAAAGQRLACSSGGEVVEADTSSNGVAAVGRAVADDALVGGKPAQEDDQGGGDTVDDDACSGTGGAAGDGPDEALGKVPGDQTTRHRPHGAAATTPSGAAAPRAYQRADVSASLQRPHGWAAAMPQRPMLTPYGSMLYGRAVPMGMGYMRPPVMVGPMMGPMAMPYMMLGAGMPVPMGLAPQMQPYAMSGASYYNRGPMGRAWDPNAYDQGM